MVSLFSTCINKASCETLAGNKKSSFRTSETRPGIQDFQRILDPGLRRNDGKGDIGKKLMNI